MRRYLGTVWVTRILAELQDLDDSDSKEGISDEICNGDSAFLMTLRWLSLRDELETKCSV